MSFRESEVSGVKYMHYEEYRSLLAKEYPSCVPYDVNSKYGQLFEILSSRYKQNTETRALILQKQLNRYAHVSLDAELTGLSKADNEALALIVKAARIADDICFIQRSSQNVECSCCNSGCNSTSTGWSTRLGRLLK